ncbi:Zinc-metallopeptidase [Forsythia ovata]|uniref:Zinc-metallopeptidase n=1 Tax=Forsythia ovata TaxID=205694 RepID=A0ABD1RNV4_9LAMI
MISLGYDYHWADQFNRFDQKGGGNRRDLERMDYPGFIKQFYPPKDWLVGSSLPSKFTLCIIETALKELTPYNQWMERAFNEHLHVPAPNMFIPTDLSLKNVSEQITLPQLLIKSPYSRLWYKPDTAFPTPKAYVKIDFNCPFTGSSPESELYDAQVAGLYYGVNNTDYGFQLFFFLYIISFLLGHCTWIQSQIDDLKTLIERIASFEVKPDRETFGKLTFEFDDMISNLGRAS